MWYGNAMDKRLEISGLYLSERDDGDLEIVGSGCTLVLDPYSARELGGELTYWGWADKKGPFRE